MRFVVFVSPGVSLRLLEALYDRGLTPSLVVTRDPRVATSSSPAAQAKKLALRALVPAMRQAAPAMLAERSNTFAFADKVGWHTMPTLDLGKPAGLEKLRNLTPDLFVVFGFGVIAPEVLRIPRLGTLGFHPSLLPEDRGANPTYWTTLEGKEQGFSTFWLTEEIDRGPIVDRVPVPLPTDADANLVIRTLTSLGAPTVANHVLRAELGGEIPAGTEQDGGSYRRRATQADAEITHELTRAEVEGRVRAGVYVGGARVDVGGTWCRVVEVLPIALGSSTGDAVKPMGAGRALIPWVCSDGESVTLMVAPFA